MPNRFGIAVLLALAFAPSAAHAQSAQWFATPAPAAEEGASSPLVGITPVVAQSGTSLVAKASQGNLYSANAVNLTAIASFLVIVNVSAVPASGASLTPQECVPLPANGTAAANYGAGPPDAYSAGIVVLISTTCATYTPASLSAFIKARVR